MLFYGSNGPDLIQSVSLNLTENGLEMHWISVRFYEMGVMSSSIVHRSVIYLYIQYTQLIDREVERYEFTHKQ